MRRHYRISIPHGHELIDQDVDTVEMPLNVLYDLIRDPIPHRAGQTLSSYLQDLANAYEFDLTEHDHE